MENKTQTVEDIKEVEYWAEAGGSRVNFKQLKNGDVEITFLHTVGGFDFEETHKETLASYRFDSVAKAFGYKLNSQIQQSNEKYLEEFRKWVKKTCKQDADEFSVWEVWDRDFDNFKNGRSSEFENFKKEQRHE